LSIQVTKRWRPDCRQAIWEESQAGRCGGNSPPIGCTPRNECSEEGQTIVLRVLKEQALASDLPVNVIGENSIAHTALARRHKQ
jgi:hypothetical protein